MKYLINRSPQPRSYGASQISESGIRTCPNVDQTRSRLTPCTHKISGYHPLVHG
ncbi:hypothetical protein B0H19DRAFT_51477 [Mycena capillaripes]|nr:hypothetical protein B0H19DRAFT_51477 [Mycena capillaripes]